MAGRTRIKKPISKKSQTDAETQTSPDKYLVEITRLKEEANSLRLELHRLKQEQQPNSMPQKQTKEVIIAVADSPQQKIPLKGCSCRGKCASRVCGCVKKQVACTAACKCTHTRCENKDHNKENTDGHNARAQISPEMESNIKLMSSLKLQKKREKEDTERAAGPSTNQPKQADRIKKGLFSPETPKTLSHDVSISNLQLNTPIRFNGSKKKSDAIHDLSVQDDSTPKQNRNEDSLSDPLEEIVESRLHTERPMASSGQLNKKRLISVYRNGRKPRAAVLTSNGTLEVYSPDEDKSIKKKAKGKNVEQVLTEPPSSSRHLEQSWQNSDSEEPEFGVINPMQPTRQLQRTPVSASSIGNQLRRSESPSPYVEAIKLETRSIPTSAPPQDIDQPQVNWEEHCKQLVHCKHCHRTFYPHRIERHESTCKRI